MRKAIGCLCLCVAVLAAGCKSGSLGQQNYSWGRYLKQPVHIRLSAPRMLVKEDIFARLSEALYEAANVPEERAYNALMLVGGEQLLTIADTERPGHYGHFYKPKKFHLGKVARITTRSELYKQLGEPEWVEAMSAVGCATWSLYEGDERVGFRVLKVQAGLLRKGERLAYLFVQDGESWPKTTRR